MKNNSNVIPYRLKFLQSGRTCGSNRLLLALGANISGAWGQPKDTLLHSLRELSGAGLPPLCCSPFFRTRPLGTCPQPDFLNAVVLTQATRPPAQLLRLVKGLERRPAAGPVPPGGRGPSTSTFWIMAAGGSAGRRRGSAAAGSFCRIRRRIGAPLFSFP